MTSSSSIEERSKRETGALQCSPMREIQLKRNCVEEEPHERVIVAVAVYCKERMYYGASMLYSSSSI